MLRHILLVAPWITKILLMILLGGCSAFDRLPDKGQELVQKKSFQKVFLAPYDSVWRAAHTTLKYSLSQTNQDTGVVETDYIKAVEGFQTPESNPPSQGQRYKIFMTFAKGKLDGKESTRVTIEKKIEIHKDFFSEPITISTDGVEEQIIFYRMERELIVEEALRKASIRGQ